MALLRIAQILFTLTLAIASTSAVRAHTHLDLGINSTTLSAGTVRQLAPSSYSPGNIAVCYTPFHNAEYPLFGGPVNANRLRGAIEDDFRLLSKHVTHVRTYHAMHYDIEIAPIAAKFGLKVYLGVFLTKESWGSIETNAAVNAIKKYSNTVEAVFVGNENLVDFRQRSGDILSKVNEIKRRAGGDAWRVKYGTVQRVNEFLDPRFDYEMQQLNNNLDLLGVNIYPFFNNGYDGNRPTDLLDAQWKAVTTKWPSSKIRLTETGFPTAGAPSTISPSVKPNLDSSFKYYKGVVNWNPSNYAGKPKFWFQAFDRKAGDPAAYADFERFFGFFTTEKYQKRADYPRLRNAAAPPSPSPSPTLPPFSGACAIENGVDYSGNDIGSAYAPRAHDCFVKCNAFAGCGAFTWTPFSGGTCWFKSSRGNPVTNSKAKSAVTCTCNLGSLETNVDLAGNDIGEAPGGNAEVCISMCYGRAGCKAFTWSNFNGGTCWLKSGKGSTTYTKGVVSGVIC